MAGDEATSWAGSSSTKRGSRVTDIAQGGVMVMARRGARCRLLVLLAIDRAAALHHAAWPVARARVHCRSLDEEDFELVDTLEDTRFYGPPLSLFTWWRKARELARALVIDRTSESNFAWHAIHSPGRVLFAERSSLNNGLVKITAHGPWRCMMFDDVEQGIAYFDDDESPRNDVLGFQYLRVAAAAAMSFRQIARDGPLASADDGVLCVGLGTGALPAYLSHHFGGDVRVDVVEIDPLVVRAASSVLQCDLREPDAANADGSDESLSSYGVALGDAASYMKSSAERLRESGEECGGRCAIILDAYNAEGETPAHLMRLDFLQDCRDTLGPGGVLVANVFNGASGSPARDAAERFAALLEQAVGPVMSLEVPTQEESLVLLARPGTPLERPGARELRAAALAAWRPAGLGRKAARLVRRYLWVETSGSERELVAASDPPSDGREYAEELVPPPSTAGGSDADDAIVDLALLRRGSSATEWMAAAGPPHGRNPPHDT